MQPFIKKRNVGVINNIINVGRYVTGKRGVASSAATPCVDKAYAVPPTSVLWFRARSGRRFLLVRTIEEHCTGWLSVTGVHSGAVAVPSAVRHTPPFAEPTKTVLFAPVATTWIAPACGGKGGGEKKWKD